MERVNGGEFSLVPAFSLAFEERVLNSLSEQEGSEVAKLTVFINSLVY